MARICKIVKFIVVPLISIIVATDSVLIQSTGASYRGKYLGPLTSRKHSVSGHVYAVDSRTLHLQNFNYDGTGPDAFFWVGFTESPSPQGIIVPNERGTKEVLTAYHNADITISLPDGLTLRDIKWFAVWCRAYEVNFGDLYIPPNLDYPQPHVIGSIVGQGIASGPIVVVDAQTILVPDFTFDGQAPDLHFWVGRGSPGPDGIRVPDETGGDAGLAKADKKTLVLSLPGDLTIFDIDYFGVYSRAYNIDYGHVRIQPGLNVPPSLRMLGISPQTRLNCEVLHDESALEVRWSVVGSGETIVFQLVGRIDNGNYMAFGLSGENDRSVMLGGDVAVGWLDQSNSRGHVTDYYLERKSTCNGNTGACPDVQWKEGTNNVRMLSAASVNGFTILTYQRKLGAADIYDKPILTNGSQPVIWAVGPINNGEVQYHFLRNKDDLSIDFGRVPKWNCPEPEAEPKSSPNSPSPATMLLQSTQSKTFPHTRPHYGGNSNNNNNIDETSSAATLMTTTTTTFIPTYSTTTTRVPPITTTTTTTSTTTTTPRPSPSLTTGESSSNQESKPAATAPSPAAWAVPPIPCHEPDDRVYYAQLGPTGGTYGYRSITGRQEKPQEAWYINGLLLPDLYLVRGLNYTFVIQGGDNADLPTDYNPFYITDDPEGGHETKSLIERQGVKVYAGVEIDSRGRNMPSAVGKLCRWMESGNQPADFFTSYAAYQRSLFLNCDKGHSGILHFTPDRNTPDLIYYQSYTRRHLGWKIHVVDDCEVPSESRHEPIHPLQQQPLLVKSDNDTPMLHQQQEQHLSLAQIQQQQQGSLHLDEQSRNSVQRPGETVNHQSVVAPLLPIGDSKPILHGSPAVDVVSPVAGISSDRPMENTAYLFTAASSSPVGGPGRLPTLTGIKNLHLSPAQSQNPQQHQQQQMPSIISLDGNRLLINAKPINANGLPVTHGIASYSPLQGHTVVSMPSQPDAFHFPNHPNTAFIQVAVDPPQAASGGIGGVATGGGITGNRGAFSPATFQLAAGPMPEGHLMRRTGPTVVVSQQQPQPSQQSISLSQLKFPDSRHPDFFSSRAPLLSHPIRYDGIPIVYATTGSPIPSRLNSNNNPISFLATQHGDKPHHQFPELAAGGQSSLIRLRSGIAGSTIVGAATDNLKYVEVPNSHNIHVIHEAGAGSRIAPSWTQARNLPKREQKLPYSVRLGNGRMRASLKSVAHGPGDIRGNENVHEARKMNVPSDSPQQSSAQRSGRVTQGPPALLKERNKSSNINGAEGLLEGTTTSLQWSTRCNTSENSSSCDNGRGGNLSQGEQQKPLASPLSVIPSSSSGTEHGEISTTQPPTTLSQQSASGIAQGENDHHPTTELSKASSQRKLLVRPWKIQSSSPPTLPSLRLRVIPIELGSSTSAPFLSTSTLNSITTANNSNDDGYEETENDEKMKQSRRRKTQKPTYLTFMGSSFSGNFGNDTAIQNARPTTFSKKIHPAESYSRSIPTTPISGYFINNKKVAPSTSSPSSSVSESKTSSSTTWPVLESFSPVFRPSPLDVDGFNISLNFPRNDQQRHQKQKQLERQKQGFGRNIASDEGVSTPGLMISSSAHQSKLSNSASPPQGHQFTSGQRKFQHPQLLVNIGGPFPTSKSEHRGKALFFNSHPTASTLSSQSSRLTNPMSILSTTSSTISAGNRAFPYFSRPVERTPAGFSLPHAYFHEATKLFNFHRQRPYNPQHQHLNSYNHHQQHQHLHFIPHGLRLPPPEPLRHPPFPMLSPPLRRFPPFPPSLPSNEPQNVHNHYMRIGSSSGDTAPVSTSPHLQNGRIYQTINRNQGLINSRQDLLASQSSISPVITIISTPRSTYATSARTILTPAFNQEASDTVESKTRFHSLQEDNANDNVNPSDSHLVRRKQIIKIKMNRGNTRGSWAHLSPNKKEESISEQRKRPQEAITATVSPSTSYSAVDGEKGASLSQENSIQSGKLETTINAQRTLLRRVGNKSSWRRRSSTTSTTTTAPSTTSLELSERMEATEEGGADGGAWNEGGSLKDDHKAGDGEDENGSPDPLSLTLLTDIWQTINQDNGSKTPSQKPLAVAPPLSGSLTPTAIASAGSLQRYNFQREHLTGLPTTAANRQIPPRLLLNGGGSNSRRPGLTPPLLYPIRRQPAILSHHFGQRPFRNGKDHSV